MRVTLRKNSCVPRRAAVEEDLEKGPKQGSNKMMGATPEWDPHFIETLGSSLPAVSTPIFASIYWLSITYIEEFLEIVHTFAPLQPQHLQNFVYAETFGE